MKNDNAMVYAALTPNSKDSPIKIRQGDFPMWKQEEYEMNIPKEFIRELRKNYKDILGEIDHMCGEHALKLLDEAILKTLLED